MDQNRFSVWNNDLKQLRADTKKDKRHEIKSKFVIDPESKFNNYWSKFMTVLLMYTAIVIPYRVSFIESDDVGWAVAEYSISCLFLIDFCINCVLGYYDREKKLVTDNRKILLNYLFGWMIPDILACVPFNLIFDQDQHYNNIARVARLQRLNRLFKITRILRIVKVMKNSNQMLKHISQVLKISMAFDRIFWFAFTYIIILHLVTCFWVFIASIDSTSANWISVGQYEDAENSELYIISLYWTITTLMKVGYGDIVATNIPEKVFNIIVMTIGMIFYSYAVSSLTNVLSSLDSRKAKLKNQLMILEQVNKEYSLNKSFYLQITRALEFNNKKSRHGIEEFVKDLPGTLGNNVLIFAYEKVLSDNFFFEKKSTDFAAWVAPRLKFFRAEASEVVYTEDDYASQMYFITLGAVEFVLFRDSRVIPYYELESKYYFGEVDILFSEDNKYLHSTQAREITEMLTLSKENFTLLLGNFEIEASYICEKARERLERINEKLKDTEIKLKNKDYSIEKRKTYPQQTEFIFSERTKMSFKSDCSLDSDKAHSSNLFMKIIESKKQTPCRGKDIKKKADELEKESEELKSILIELQNQVSAKYPKFVKKVPKFSPESSSSESEQSSNESDCSIK